MEEDKELEALLETEENIFLEEFQEAENNLSQENQKLSNAQKVRIEKNRLKALNLKKSRLVSSHPYQKNDVKSVTGEAITNRKVPKVSEKKVVDTGAGFFIEEESEVEKERGTRIQIFDPAPILPPDEPCCFDCGDTFSDSYLLKTFDYLVCDGCKDTEKNGKHELITKTEAKKEFLLQDFDFDGRPPALKYIVRKNPHNPRWGEMKLFLRVQVEKRALEVWGSEATLEAEFEKKEEARQKSKLKKFDNSMKELKMKVRGSLFKKEKSVHEHIYGEESYNEEDDEYAKTCVECNFTLTYEKM